MSYSKIQKKLPETSKSSKAKKVVNDLAENQAAFALLNISASDAISTQTIQEWKDAVALKAQSAIIKITPSSPNASHIIDAQNKLIASTSIQAIIGQTKSSNMHNAQTQTPSIYKFAISDTLKNAFYKYCQKNHPIQYTNIVSAYKSGDQKMREICELALQKPLNSVTVSYGGTKGRAGYDVNCVSELLFKAFSEFAKELQDNVINEVKKTANTIHITAEQANKLSKLHSIDYTDANSVVFALSRLGKNNTGSDQGTNTAGIFAITSPSNSGYDVYLDETVKESTLKLLEEQGYHAVKPVIEPTGGSTNLGM